MPHRRRFRVALSFSGDRREFVAAVAALLADRLGRSRVFYDEFHLAGLARPNLDIYLGKIYSLESDLVVPFYSAGYQQKRWCQLEWRRMRYIIFNIEDVRVMPFRFDDTPIDGVLPIDGYVKIESQSPREVADLILSRLEELPEANPDPRDSAMPNSSETPPEAAALPADPPGTEHSHALSTEVRPREPQRRVLETWPGWMLKLTLLLAILIMLFSLPQQIASAQNAMSGPTKSLAQTFAASKDIWIAFPAQFAVVGMLWLGLRRWASLRHKSDDGTAHTPIQSHPDPDLFGFIPTVEDALFGGLAGGVIGGCIIAFSYWHIESAAARLDSLLGAQRLLEAESMLVHILWFAPLASTIWSVSNQLALTWFLRRYGTRSRACFLSSEILGSATGGAVGGLLAGTIGGPLFPWINPDAGFANLDALLPGIAAAGICILLCPLFFSYRGNGRRVARSVAFLFGIILTGVAIIYLLDIKGLLRYLDWLFTAGASPINVVWGGIIIAIIPGALFGTINGITLSLRSARI